MNELIINKFGVLEHDRKRSPHLCYKKEISSQIIRLNKIILPESCSCFTTTWNFLTHHAAISPSSLKFESTNIDAHVSAITSKNYMSIIEPMLI